MNLRSAAVLGTGITSTTSTKVSKSGNISLTAVIQKLALLSERGVSWSFKHSPHLEEIPQGNLLILFQQGVRHCQNTHRVVACCFDSWHFTKSSSWSGGWTQTSAERPTVICSQALRFWNLSDPKPHTKQLKLTSLFIYISQELFLQRKIVKPEQKKKKKRCF